MYSTVMHGRSGMTIWDRPSHPYNAGMENVGFFTDQAGIACTTRETPWGCSASRMEGELRSVY